MFSSKIGSWKKVIAGFAGFGFILSFFLGIIGGVLIGAVIFRAIIFAVVFAGISFIILKLIESYIPELLSSDSEDIDEEDSSVVFEAEDGDSSDAEDLSGRNLDITIEDDEPSFLSEDEGDEIPGSAKVKNGVHQRESRTSEMELDSSEYDGKADDGSAAELIEEAESEEEVKELDEERQFEPVRAASATAKAGGDNRFPDIEVFSDSFEQPVGSADDDGLSNIDGMGSSGAEILGGMHDTDELVKAVQTVLKKDQEG